MPSTRILLLLAICHLASSAEPAVTTTSIPAFNCLQHFRHQVKKCLQPYSAVAAIFRPEEPHRQPVNSILTHHLCLQFELSLVCLHSTLRNCPSRANVRYVQSKLGSDWAIDVRRLCFGYSPKRLPGEQATAVQKLQDSSSELGSESTPASDNEYDEDFGEPGENYGQEIVVVIPSQMEDVYPDVVLGTQRKGDLGAGHGYLRSAPRVDVELYDIPEGRNGDPSFSSASAVSWVWMTALILCSAAASCLLARC